VACGECSRGGTRPGIEREDQQNKESKGEYKVNQLRGPVWPNPVGSERLSQRMLDLGLPADVAALAARCFVYPDAATIRPVHDNQGRLARYEVDGDFYTSLLLPLERWRSLGKGGRGQDAPPVPLVREELHPAVVPVVSYHANTALAEFQAAENALCEEQQGGLALTAPRLEIQPGLLHLSQPYLAANAFFRRQQLILLARRGGSVIAAGHKWVKVSIFDVLRFCQDRDEWQDWHDITIGRGRRGRPKFTPDHYVDFAALDARADAFREYQRARAAGLVAPGVFKFNMGR
jgi:hypothetical protein